MSTARRLPTDCPPEPGVDHVLWRGVRIPFFFEAGKGWRIRKRSVHLSVDHSTGILARAPAKRAALEWLDGQANGSVKLATTTLEDLVQCYLAMPRRASNTTAAYNITQLRAICREVLRRELKAVKVHEVRPALWQEFMRRRLGGQLDLSTRRPEHVTINTAVRAAASIFKRTLRAAYSRAGFAIPSDATEIEWLQELKRPPRAVEETTWLAAWQQLPRSAMWVALGLARFAGLRKEEINACRGGWIVEHRGRWGVEVCDRPDEGFLCKTGEPRFAVLLNGELLDHLRGVKPDDYAVDLDGARDQWFKAAPQTWLRSYFDRDSVKKPLHRLRGLYLDEVKARAETRIQEAALAEAAAAAGHTSPTTTKNHYLSQ